MAIIGTAPAPILKMEDIPENLTEKVCIGVEIDSTYEIVKYLVLGVRALLDQGITDISTENPLYKEIVKNLPKIDTIRLEMVKNRGFDISKRFHPLAFYDGVVYFRGDNSEFFQHQLKLIRGKFKNSISQIDEGLIKSKEDLDEWAREMEEFYLSYYGKKSTKEDKSLQEDSGEKDEPS